MSDRGMKKWMPYRSLLEQLPSLEKMKNEKKKCEMPEISEDKAEMINEILLNHNNRELQISYFKNGYIYTIVDIIKNIDIYNRKLVTIEGRVITLDSITDLNYID